MNRQRYPGRDMTYSRAHRLALPILYGRIGHRLNVLDRDWTEFCYRCRNPLALIEEMRDVGQDLMDKNYNLTRQLAVAKHIPAYVVAWRVERPQDVEYEILRLRTETERLEGRYPIVEVKARDVYPNLHATFRSFTPDEWWRFVGGMHQDHWAGDCRNPYHVSVGGQTALMKP